jgi:hypothetical protein
MHELKRRATELLNGIREAIEKLAIKDLEKQLLSMQEASQRPDFWSDNQSAQETMKKISRLEGGAMARHRERSGGNPRAGGHGGRKPGG